MDTPEPKRPWWRKKRAIAAGLLWLMLWYPLSFAPAMWIATRLPLGPGGRTTEFAFLSWLYRPVAMALVESPEPVRDAVFFVGELGNPAGRFMRNSPGVVWVRFDPPPGEPHSATLFW